MQNSTLLPNMENMTFYGFITFVIDFVVCDFCFKIRFIASWNPGKTMTFMILNGPADMLQPKVATLHDCSIYCLLQRL